MTCLLQNKTKTSGKNDEDWALLPHSATSSVPIPFASLSSSFCSMSLWVHLLLEQVCRASISAEHHWASAVLHRRSWRLCLQPRVSCMCCRHPQTRALRAERAEVPPALTGHLSFAERGSEGEDLSCKILVDTSLSLVWDHTPWFCRQSKCCRGPAFMG